MTENPHLLSPCNLYCGVCGVYLAHRDDNQKFKERLATVYAVTPEQIRCEGCLSEDRFMHCQQCEIRQCAQEKGYSGCHECDDFPCQHIEHFPMTVGQKVILRCVPYRRKFGTEKWIQDEDARYFCPECGNKVFRGVIKCNQCKANLDLD